MAASRSSRRLSTRQTWLSQATYTLCLYQQTGDGSLLQKCLLSSLELFTPWIWNEYFHLAYQLNTFTVHNMTVTSLRHVSTWQYRLQGVHTKLKTIKTTILCLVCNPWRWYCHAETRQSEMTVQSCNVSTFSGYVKWKYSRCLFTF